VHWERVTVWRSRLLAAVLPFQTSSYGGTSSIRRRAAMPENATQMTIMQKITESVVFKSLVCTTWTVEEKALASTAFLMA